MATINSHYLTLASGYLFPEIGRRVAQYREQNPQARIIRLGIGDVTRPLPQVVVDAAKAAFDEMALASSFKGYGPEQGYTFLREAIAVNEYASRGVAITPDEIFVSDGAKCDTGNIQELFDARCRIAITDPVYPVYVDSQVMAGRAGERDQAGRYDQLVYLPALPENGFLPELPAKKIDVVYLCFPNNPTGVVAPLSYLKMWVDFALQNDVIILFDAAYEAFITDQTIPHSIFEIEGAKNCAIEFRSFSKKAGFTGTRCAFTVVPKDLMGRDGEGHEVPIHPLWLRRQTTKFNGVSYPVQRAAEACYTPEGQRQIQETINYYLENARLIRQGLLKCGFSVSGGVNAPYLWFKAPVASSWDYFNHLLHTANVVTTPGAGFGACGEGFMRLSAFGDRADVEEAMERISGIPASG
ncbi:MAG: hypothetical protein ACD_62C00126G0015 [uncultured bacterium]|nr:MAG: hypothetical protein ACD_62C00126G0015 [uncultured bacterium]